jgi:hypothetical protein
MGELFGAKSHHEETERDRSQRPQIFRARVIDFGIVLRANESCTLHLVITLRDEKVE